MKISYITILFTLVTSFFACNSSNSIRLEYEKGTEFEIVNIFNDPSYRQCEHNLFKSFPDSEVNGLLRCLTRKDQACLAMVSNGWNLYWDLRKNLSSSFEYREKDPRDKSIPNKPIVLDFGEHSLFIFAYPNDNSSKILILDGTHLKVEAREVNIALTEDNLLTKGNALYDKKSGNEFFRIRKSF